MFRKSQKLVAVHPVINQQVERKRDDEKHEEVLIDIEDVSVHEIRASSIITQSKLPNSNYVINPYVGCMHGCKYCYARFMRRFTGHEEEWGRFVDVKVNAAELIPKWVSTKYSGKSVTLGSVTDPYQPLEVRYCLTRSVLEKLVISQPKLYVMTKSSLVVRDIDVLKRFESCRVIISLSLLDDDVRRQIEPRANPVEKRLKTLEKLHTAGIYTVLFIAPILPHLTDWHSLILRTKSFVDEYWFENLNTYASIRTNMHQFLMAVKPELVEEYSRIYSVGSNYWESEEIAIDTFCKEQGVNTTFYFHHTATMRQKRVRATPPEEEGDALPTKTRQKLVP